MSQQLEDGYAADRFEVRVREDSLRTWITPAGDLDLSTTDGFDRCVWDAQINSRRVVLDLRALLFIDSAGLRSILAARLRAADWRCHLEIIGAPGQVKNMMALTGYDKPRLRVDRLRDATGEHWSTFGPHPPLATTAR